jgi:hypothetical protein
MVGSHENWGNFKCHKWGELLRHSHRALIRELRDNAGMASTAACRQKRRIGPNDEIVTLQTTAQYSLRLTF